MTKNLHFIKNQFIDLQKWNKTIDRAYNGNIYAYSWYLDMLGEWDAIIEDDYKAIMPLINLHESHSPFITQPYFGRQLGIYSQDMLFPDDVKSFIDFIPSRYKYIKMNLNKYLNVLGDELLTVSQKKIYELDLINTHDKIKANYSEATRTILAETDTNGQTIIRGMLPSDIINLYTKNQLPDIPLKATDLNILNRIISFSLTHHIGELFGVYSQYNNLCGGAFLLASHQKLTMVFMGITTEGLENMSMYKLTDHIIEFYSGRPITLSFDVVDKLCSQMFYSGFGAKEYTFPQVIIDRNSFFNKITQKMNDWLK